MVNEIQLFESPDPSPSDFCLCGWMKSEVYKRKVDTADELLTHILVAVARIQKREDKLRRTQHAIFAHELRSSLRLAVGFCNIYCVL
jgi:hypothetical protein